MTHTHNEEKISNNLFDLQFHIVKKKNNIGGAEGRFIPGISESFQLEAIIERNESLLVLKWNRI